MKFMTEDVIAGVMRYLVEVVFAELLMIDLGLSCSLDGDERSSRLIAWCTPRCAGGEDSGGGKHPESRAARRGSV